MCDVSKGLHTSALTDPQVKNKTRNRCQLLMPLTSVAPRVPVTAVPQHLATADGCLQAWPRPSEPLFQALQVELTEMPMSKQYKKYRGTCRTRAFGLDVETFNMSSPVVASVSWPQSSLGGEEPSLRRFVPLGAAQPPPGKASHGVGSNPAFPRASAHHPAKSCSCRPCRRRGAGHGAGPPRGFIHLEEARRHLLIIGSY